MIGGSAIEFSWLTPHEIQCILEQYKENRTEEMKGQAELARMAGYLAGVLAMKDTGDKTPSQIFPFEWEEENKKTGKVKIEKIGR